jgi:hypothetical protein
MLALKYEFITYEFILKMSWSEERTERLTVWCTRGWGKNS